MVSSIRHRKFEVRAKILVDSVHLTFHFPIDIVDKTASFVARNGPSFESKVKDAEANNAKFNFLNPHDPYHAYYLRKVKDFMEGKATMPGGTDQGTPLAPTPVVQPPTTKVPFLSVSGGSKLIDFFLQVPAKVQSEMSKFLEPIIIKDPPSEYEFMIEPPSIAAQEL